MRTSPPNAIAPFASLLSVALAGCILPYFERSEDGSGTGGGNAIATSVTSGEGGNAIATTATTTAGDGGNAPATTSTGEGSGAGGESSEGMVAVEGGTYTMGQVAVTVTVDPFEIDPTEVTVDAYAACVTDGVCSSPSNGMPNCNWGLSGVGNHPINCVDWNQATAYCEWLEKRLPTEEEWEWAARGRAAASVYPWGNQEPTPELACWNRSDGTCEVGAFPSGDAPGGIHDLAGNVWEWTSTMYDGSTRVSRGGSWYYGEFSGDGSGLRAAHRNGSDQSNRDDRLGFRCAR